MVSRSDDQAGLKTRLYAIDSDGVIEPAADRLVRPVQPEDDRQVLRRGWRRELGIENPRDLITYILQVQPRLAVGRLGNRRADRCVERSQLTTRQRTRLAADAAVDLVVHRVEIRALQVAAIRIDLHRGRVNLSPHCTTQVGKKLRRAV